VWLGAVAYKVGRRSLLVEATALAVELLKSDVEIFGYECSERDCARRAELLKFLTTSRGTASCSPQPPQKMEGMLLPRSCAILERMGVKDSVFDS